MRLFVEFIYWTIIVSAVLLVNAGISHFLIYTLFLSQPHRSTDVLNKFGILGIIYSIRFSKPFSDGTYATVCRI